MLKFLSFEIIAISFPWKEERKKPDFRFREKTWNLLAIHEFPLVKIVKNYFPFHENRQLEEKKEQLEWFDEVVKRVVLWNVFMIKNSPFNLFKKKINNSEKKKKKIANSSEAIDYLRIFGHR